MASVWRRARARRRGEGGGRAHGRSTLVTSDDRRPGRGGGRNDNDGGDKNNPAPTKLKKELLGRMSEGTRHCQGDGPIAIISK